MKGRRLIIFGALVAVLAVALMMKPPPKPVRISDGTLIGLSRLKFGTSNAFIHGSGLERLLGSLLPTNGVRVGSVQLNRPKPSNNYRLEQSTLSAEFRFSGLVVDNGSSRILSPKFHREFRLLITGVDGFPYVEEFLRTARYSDGVFLYVNSTSFPRGSPVLHFQVQQHDERLAPWRTVAEFHRPNPARDEARKWTTEAFPVRRITNDVELLIDTVTVSPRDSNKWEYFWQATVNIPFQVRVNGVLKTNWTLHQVNGKDTSGNSLFIGAIRESRNDWSIYHAFRSLDPRKVWRLSADVAPESVFAPDELFTFEVPIPPAASFVTNFGGAELKVGWVNGNMLSVELPGNSAGKRLIFVEARDGNGRPIGEHSGSWGRTRFWKSINLPGVSPATLGAPPTSSTGAITATIAITRNIPVEITIQPKLDPSGSP